MYFQKQTLPINENTAIVGVNGTGKSTIIDAIQMILLGQKLSKFNSSASAEKRNLESYVRGYVNSDNKEYLRSGDVITYLALEVNINNINHIFGLNVEYKYNLNKLSDPKYFYIKDCDLYDSLFVTENNYPKNYDTFSKEVKKNYEFIPFQTLSGYQTKIKEVFGLKNDNSYFKILSRAIGLKNISKCDSFMNDFVLDESIIDISNIKHNIEEITKIEKKMDLEEAKLTDLREICVIGNQINADNEKVKELKIKKELGTKKLNEIEIDDLNKQNESLNDAISNENRIIERLNENERVLNKEHAERTKMLDEISPDLTRKEEELLLIEKEYNETHVTLNTFIEKCKNQLSSINALKPLKNAVFNEFYEYLKNEQFDTETSERKFKTFRNEANIISKEYDKQEINLQIQLSIVRDQIKDLKEIIIKLKNNEPVYKNNYVEFRNYIKKGLENKFLCDVEVGFLCEYLDITDDSWRNAIEGYLGDQRFYVIVPNEYYKEALKLYNQGTSFYGVKLINGLKVPNKEATPDTLGSLITASNQIALNYARYILNRVHFAKDIYDLDHYDISITKECMCYQNYSSWRINPRIYNESYIGQNGLKKQLEERILQAEKLRDDYNELLTKKNLIVDKNEKIKNQIKFVTSIIENNAYFISIDKDNDLFNKKEKLSSDIITYKEKPRYIQIKAMIGETEKAIEVNKNQMVEHNNRVVSHKTQVMGNCEKIDEKKLNITSAIEKLKNYDHNLVEEYKLEVNKTNITKSTGLNFDIIIRNLEKTIDVGKIKLENKMKNVRDCYNINLAPVYEELDSFIKEKNKIDDSIFKYKEKLVKMNESHRKLFFSEFLVRLNNSVEEAKETIKNLNNSLSTFTFGKDYYYIKASITGNTDLKTIYEYAVEYNSDDSARGLFVDRDIEDKKRNEVEKILNTYMFSENVATQMMVVDYRKYLEFDVEVITPEGRKSLNKVINSQSGGEVQVPFYILSGVAFKQTLDYKRNKDSLGIVLYDEAFDKMDSQRINAMLQFYKHKLGLQIILAAPGKLDSLANNVETVLAVVRDGDKAEVSDITHDL